MSEDQRKAELEAELTERLTSAAAETLRRQQARAEQRRQLRANRTIGLARRHATKRARTADP